MLLPQSKYRQLPSTFFRTGITEILDRNELSKFEESPICPLCNSTDIKFFFLPEREFESGSRLITGPRIRNREGKKGFFVLPYRPPQFHLTCNRCNFDWYMSTKEEENVSTEHKVTEVVTEKKE